MFFFLIKKNEKIKGCFQPFCAAFRDVKRTNEWINIQTTSAFVF